MTKEAMREELQKLYDESISCCCPSDTHKNPLVLWRTLERVHAGQHCPPELIDRFVQELNCKSDAWHARDAEVQALKDELAKYKNAEPVAWRCWTKNLVWLSTKPEDDGWEGSGNEPLFTHPEGETK